MLLIIGYSFFPLLGFSVYGLLLIFFPKAMMTFRDFNASMKGSLFKNNLEYRDNAVFTTRIMGFVFLVLGIGLFMLINGWLDFLIY